jgi:hypothetical protein
MAAFTIPHRQASTRDGIRAPKQALTTLATALLAASVLLPAGAQAVGSLASVDIVARGDARILPAIWGQGRQWVVGAPGQEYAIRICNATAGRVLAVTSVDGINVITGDTASPDQSGYVLDGHACMDVAGWRKNMARTAAFYFTELPDSYAARTGRPDNLGVIGVAIFREKTPPPVAWRAPARMAADARHEAPAAAAPDAGATAASSAEAKRLAGAMDAAASAPRAQLGTGHGRSEHSRAHQVQFERESSAPAEMIAVHYDRRENLVAMGVLPPPVLAQSRPANPFPRWPHFVPDPPSR